MFFFEELFFQYSSILKSKYGIGVVRVHSFIVFSKSGLYVQYIVHKLPIYKEYQIVCPLVGIGFICNPSLARGGHTRLRVRGWGSPNSDDWRKSLALCQLCDIVYRIRGEPFQLTNLPAAFLLFLRSPGFITQE